MNLTWEITRLSDVKSVWERWWDGCVIQFRNLLVQDCTGHWEVKEFSWWAFFFYENKTDVRVDHLAPVVKALIEIETSQPAVQ